MQVQTPDIGVEQALVSDILVKVGDYISENDSIILLESDKASVEVPSPAAGQVKSILVRQGDTVRQGIGLIELDVNVQDNVQQTPITPQQTSPEQRIQQNNISTTEQSKQEGQEVDVRVPDIGVEKAVVAEVLIRVGDRIAVNDSVVVVESDKATVEVPSPVAGEVTAIAVKAGDVVKEGVSLFTLKSTSISDHLPTTPKLDSEKTVPENSRTTATQPIEPSKPINPLSDAQLAINAKVYAGPAVRQLARELGVVLSSVMATGAHGRIVKEDVYAYVKSHLNQTTAISSSVATASLPSLPDFSAFGGGEIKAMTRLQQVSVPQLALSTYIPQVTQFDLADITDLEAWRNQLKQDFKVQNISLTILAFIAKVTAYLLKQEPYFAAHLADDQKSVLLRHEIHMGIAVATDEGLTVPVLRHPEQKSIKQIAQELAELSQKARDKKLSPKELQGANFTITSLGSIGGTAFTPLVNWPQVAILGLSPATMQPVWNGQEFEPRLMLPLSLSYDHRVINGADAARFARKLTLLLKDIRSILL